MKKTLLSFRLSVWRLVTLFFDIALITLICFVVSSCVSFNKDHALTSVSKKTKSTENGAEVEYQILPPTLKVFQNKYAAKIDQKAIELDAAHNEGESAQILLINLKKDRNFSVKVSNLTDKNGKYIKPEIGVVGYVPVKHPSIVGFHTFGKFPDPISPVNTVTVKKNMSQSLFYTVYVPENAPSGIYEGYVSIYENTQDTTQVSGDVSNLKKRLEIPVRLTVYNVALPKTSYLKTWFGNPARFIKPYYIEGFWTEQKLNTLYKEYLKYRINIGYTVDTKNLFSKDENGILVADWTRFDADVEQKLAEGVNVFTVPIDVGYDILSEKSKEERKRVEQEFSLLNQHLVEKKWTEFFVWYNFDEPMDHKANTVIEIFDWAKKFAPNINNLLTLGFSSKHAIKKFANHVAIWTPHINQYDPAFFVKRQKTGNAVWIYTCVQNAYNSYPDNWKIDTNGTAHRALGWWLFKNEIDGYLYWSIGYWKRRNPWEDAETFLFGNGDGSIIYPPFDKASVPYPSTRLHITRDTIEDFDLLTMLKHKFRDQPKNEEVENILSAKSVIFSGKKYTNDDFEFIRLHKRILQLLEN